MFLPFLPDQPIRLLDHMDKPNIKSMSETNTFGMFVTILNELTTKLITVILHGFPGQDKYT